MHVLGLVSTALMAAPCSVVMCSMVLISVVFISSVDLDQHGTDIAYLQRGHVRTQ